MPFHIAGHVDVGEEHLDRHVARADRKGLGGAIGLQNKEASVEECFHREHPDQGLVLDDEDDRLGQVTHASLRGGGGRCSLGPGI